MELTFTEEQLAWCRKVSRGRSDYPFDRDDLLSEAMVAVWKASTAGVKNPEAWSKTCFFNAKREIWRRFKTIKRWCKPTPFPESGADSLVDPLAVDPSLVVEAGDLYQGGPPIEVEPCLGCGTTGGSVGHRLTVNAKPRRTKGLCNACYTKESRCQG